ncbi:MAG: hypothetical protein IPJ39_21920 [Saprospiraceae bacterium]|nr:hypothetical protein [Saprospiraceae bacterium]
MLFEGMFNRWVVNRIIEKLDRKKIPYYHISPEFTDTTLETRTNRANHVFSIRILMSGFSRFMLMQVAAPV